MGTKQVYMPPEAKVVNLLDFDLDKIEEYFQYAAFERRISKTKYHKIANAMMDSKFTDNVLRVVESLGPTKYEVLDGQHRVEALRYAREYFGLQRYDLILMLYSIRARKPTPFRVGMNRPKTSSIRKIL